MVPSSAAVPRVTRTPSSNKSRSDGALCNAAHGNAARGASSDAAPPITTTVTQRRTSPRKTAYLGHHESQLSQPLLSPFSQVETNPTNGLVESQLTVDDAINFSHSGIHFYNVFVIPRSELGTKDTCDTTVVVGDTFKCK